MVRATSGVEIGDQPFVTIRALSVAENSAAITRWYADLARFNHDPPGWRATQAMSASLTKLAFGH
jgi:hypothetical protein